MTEKLELEGNCVLSVVYLAREDMDSLFEIELELLGQMHKQRIRMSDAIFVVNVGDYIESGVAGEIEYAKSLGEEILYLE